MQWHDVHEFGISGKMWQDTARPFDRLPARAEGVVTEAVWNLSQESAGLWVDFCSDAGSLYARCKLYAEPPLLDHSIRYLDLYCRDAAGRWRWAGFSQQGIKVSNETPLIEGLQPQWRQWRIYLPLSYRVAHLEIGVREEASIRPAEADSRPPVVIYGTSIVHGVSGPSRPGMAWPAIVGRRLDWPVINLGFSGNAFMEPDLGQLLAELEPSALVIDPLPNMSKELVEKNAEGFLRAWFKVRPQTPTLMIEDRIHTDAWLQPGYLPAQQEKQVAYKQIADKFRSIGHPVYYLPGKDLLGDDCEGTTDASHPNDLGTMRYADAVTPVLAGILGLK